MVPLMKINFLLLTTNFLNRHIDFGFAFIAHLHREEKDTMSPKGDTILVRAKDNTMMIIRTTIATIYRDI